MALTNLTLPNERAGTNPQALELGGTHRGFPGIELDLHWTPKTLAAVKVKHPERLEVKHDPE